MAIADHYAQRVWCFPECVPVGVSAINRAPESSVRVTSVAGKGNKLVTLTATGFERQTSSCRERELAVRC